MFLAACVEMPVETVRADRQSTVDSVYQNPNANFARYNKLLPLPLEIYYVEGMHRPDAAELARIRQIFRDAFLAEIGDDYPLVSSPGLDVLTVRASLVDRDTSPLAETGPGGFGAPALIAEGHLTFLMELSDSKSGEILLQAADREKNQGLIDESAVDSNWQRTEQAAARWAGLFKNFLDTHLGP